MKIAVAALLAAVALPGLALAEQATWNVDPAHTHAGFTVRHMVITNVRGEFGKTSGVVRLDDQDPTKSNVEVTIDTTSINTGVDARDKDLRSENFFDVAKYPTITFKSTKIEKAGDGKYQVTGDLTMKGVTKPVVLDVEGPTAEVKDPWGNTRRGVSAKTTINRRDFGLTYSKAIEAGPVVGDEVKIEIESELVKEAPKAAAAAAEKPAKPAAKAGAKPMRATGK
jgi:polyisoprenoid-binding protein YceI